MDPETGGAAADPGGPQDRGGPATRDETARPGAPDVPGPAGGEAGRRAGDGASPGRELPRRIPRGRGSRPATGGRAAARPRLPVRGADSRAVPVHPDPAERTTERVVEIVAGDYLLTVNPVDGCEVTGCPPASRPAPERLTPQQRIKADQAAQPPSLARGAAAELPLLERHEVRERLLGLLAQGRSVRVTGRRGAGRSALLRTVAEGCAELAPDGVIQLSGYRRTSRELVYALFSSVYGASRHRPDRAAVLESLREVGAIVLVDDLEFGGAELEELLRAAPECAFLVTVVPDAPAPASDSRIEEVFLPGLTHLACLDLLEQAIDRPMDGEEAVWATDLWFESEGLALRFVQAGALLRHRDARRAELVEKLAAAEGDPFDRDASSAGEDEPGEEPPYEAAREEPDAAVPLLTLAESVAPAEQLAVELSPAAREVLGFAVVLGGECPNPAHLPALVGDTHGDAALAELVVCGLAVPVASHYRLAAGVREQLAPQERGEARAQTAARYFAWWTGHPSVTPERVALEAEVVLAALAASRDAGDHGTTVELARAAAPAFAVALRWDAWERVLRLGQEAARLSGDVAQEAYFHHDLGVLALCTGKTDRARAELEASIALRGALADRQGTVVGRRTLALVSDRLQGLGGGLMAPAGTGTPSPGAVNLRRAVEAATQISVPLADDKTIESRTVTTEVLGGSGRSPGSRPTEAALTRRSAGSPAATVAAPLPSAPRPRARAVSSRRNLAAASAGVLLAAVVGAVVLLGGEGGPGGGPRTPMKVAPVEPSSGELADGGGAPHEDPSSVGPDPTRSREPATPAQVPRSRLVPRSTTDPSPSPSRPTGSRSPSSEGSSSGGSSGSSGGSGTSGSEGSGGATTGGSTTGTTTAGGSTTGSTTGGTTGDTASGGTTTTGTTTGTTDGGVTGTTTDGGVTGASATSTPSPSTTIPEQGTGG